jgi:hypothetical protein
MPVPGRAGRPDNRVDSALARQAASIHLATCSAGTARRFPAGHGRRTGFLRLRCYDRLALRHAAAVCGCVSRHDQGGACARRADPAARPRRRAAVHARPLRRSDSAHGARGHYSGSQSKAWLRRADGRRRSPRALSVSGGAKTTLPGPSKAGVTAATPGLRVVTLARQHADRLFARRSRPRA